jgi:tRNA-2-methylthio-N6-dimethylallyladenosine synthase
VSLSKIFSPVIDETIQGTGYQSGNELNSSAAAAPLAYIETYGCQMNFSDTEIIASVLTEAGYGFTRNELAADLVLLNTCAIRENAETKIRHRLQALKSVKKHRPQLLVGVLGCMAERLKAKLLEEEKLVDIVVGPDAYRSLPQLIAQAESGQKAINVLLSREETYADIAPVRIDSNGVSAFISIMRGCNNMCSFCVVPFTRGRERSRHPESIVAEAHELFEQGYREVTLLGQNVDSYAADGVHFAALLAKVAAVSPLLRVRFSTSHPKDITDEVLETMAKYPNICKFIHLPVQSGSTRILQLMNRGYTRQWYLDKIERIKTILPNCGLSTDIIAGFCTETVAEHQETLSLMEIVGFDSAFMFYYSERPGTPAAKKLTDDVPLPEKKRRLNEIIHLQNQLSYDSNQQEIGKTVTVLIEGTSKRSADDLSGRTDNNKLVVFPKDNLSLKAADYVKVRIKSATSATLIGEVV